MHYTIADAIIVVALVSVLVMRSQALEWSLIIGTVVVPILIVAAVQRRQVLR